MKILFAFVCIFLLMQPALSRPCATCATITDRDAQDYARSRAGNRSVGASCATIWDPQLAALCRTRQGR